MLLDNHISHLLISWIVTLSMTFEDHAANWNYSVARIFTKQPEQGHVSLLHCMQVRTEMIWADRNAWCPYFSNWDEMRISQIDASHICLHSTPIAEVRRLSWVIEAEQLAWSFTRSSNTGAGYNPCETTLAWYMLWVLHLCVWFSVEMDDGLCQFFVQSLPST